MHRKPLMENIVEMLSRNASLALAVVAGVVTVLYFVRRRGNGSSRRPGTRPTVDRSRISTSTNSLSATAHFAPSSDIVDSFQKNRFSSSKICITWDVLGSLEGTWKDGAEQVMERLVTSTEVFIMCQVADDSQKKNMLDFLRKFSTMGLERKRVLFCTTTKGYEAFTRQVNPSLLITHDPAQAKFLARVLPFILLVGNEAIPFPNVQTVPTIASLLKS